METGAPPRRRTWVAIALTGLGAVAVTVALSVGLGLLFESAGEELAGSRLSDEARSEIERASCGQLEELVYEYAADWDSVRSAREARDLIDERSAELDYCPVD